MRPSALGRRQSDPAQPRRHDGRGRLPGLTLKAARRATDKRCAEAKDPMKLVRLGLLASLSIATGCVSSGRYDDLKSGRVKPISGDELEAYFRDKSAAARREPLTD